jgi:hypothetical protein
VGSIGKFKLGYYQSIFVYCTKAYFVKKAFSGDFPNIRGQHDLDYNINKGWTEIVTSFYHVSDSINGYRYTNVVPSDMTWGWLKMDSTIYFPVKKQMVIHDVQ